MVACAFAVDREVKGLDTNPTPKSLELAERF